MREEVQCREMPNGEKKVKVGVKAYSCDIACCFTDQNNNSKKIRGRG